MAAAADSLDTSPAAAADDVEATGEEEDGDDASDDDDPVGLEANSKSTSNMGSMTLQTKGKWDYILLHSRKG